MTDESRLAQIEYEESSDSDAQAQRLKDLREKATEGDANLPRATALIRSIYEDVHNRIVEKSTVRARGSNGKYLLWLRAIPADVAAMLSIRTCIQLCMGRASAYVHIQDLTTTLGKAFEMEVRIREAEKVNPMYMDKIAKQIKDNGTTNVGHITRLYNVAIERVMKGVIDNTLTQTERMQIGKFGIDACYEAGLISMAVGTFKRGTAVNYEINPEIRDFLTGYDENDVKRIISKSESVMLHQPDDWTNLNDGGYLTLRRKMAAPMLSLGNLRKSIRGKIAAALTAETAPLVFETINYLQSREYAVHEPTRDAIVRLWKAGGGVLGVPTLNPPKRPEMPLGPEWIKEGAPDNEMAIFKKWKRNVVNWHEALAKWRGKALEIGSFVRAARRTGERLWFPAYMDKRNRYYYRGSPNPQGSDLAKAVLHWQTKKALGPRGLAWLKVSIANHFGFDAERNIDRERWTDQHWPVIEKALDHPEDHPEVWGKDAPWCMFSAAWELREAYRSGNPAEYKSGVIGHQDATCSGLQHFSAMLRDPVGARYVNLDDPMKTGPKQDIYSRVAAMALSAMEKDLDSEEALTKAMARWWIANGIPRALAKKPVMTYVYGATLSGTADFIENTMETEIFPAKSMTWEDDLLSADYSMYCAKKLFEGVANTVPAAESGMVWLRSLASRNPNGKPMLWTSPIGMTVIHDYQDYDEKRVRLQSCGIELTVLREWNDNTRAHAMRNAISPNFVHSLDASHLAFTALKMKRDGLDMVGIHDSFGTHMCDIDRMNENIRAAFVEMYVNHNPMSQLLWDLGVASNPPMKGTFDMRNVYESEFFFC